MQTASSRFWTLVTVSIFFSQDIGMEFEILKSALLIMNNGKRKKAEAIDLSNQKSFGKLGEKKSNKYLGILRHHLVNKDEIKEEWNSSEKQEKFWKPNAAEEI